MPLARAARISAPAVSCFGPILTSFQSVMSLSYIAKPSQCSATGIT